ncbi:growth hormone-regulated TBC protein 1-A [Chironomus tepperi]|uniref:growth hormone-regulated TBC protein 1-A n=1 Tax=Chironomus tepperi TaxID=113505 RepID=UPI00391F84F2
MAQASEIDEYGFKRCPEEMRFIEENQEFFTKLTKQLMAWEALNSRTNPLFKSTMLKNFIRKGVPLNLRKQVWLKMSGCQRLIQQHPNLYEDLFRNQFQKEIVDSIKIDIPRTFPDNIYFDKYKVSLYNVLSAFASHNPVVSYCQGLNYIAGLILIVCAGDEEATFWLLKHLVENVSPEYHTKTMKGLKRDIEVVTELIKIRLPTVNEKMNELGLPWIVIMTKWFICLFAEVLPIETSLRVWDAIFSEGYKIIFRTSLAIVLILKDDIMKVEDINELAELFRNISKDVRFINSHEFMKFMFSLKLKRREIQVLRRNNANV